MVKTNPQDLMKLQMDAFRITGEAAAKALEGFQKLAALKEQGVLTDEEFAAAKAQLLG